MKEMSQRYVQTSPQTGRTDIAARKRYFMYHVHGILDHDTMHGISIYLIEDGGTISTIPLLSSRGCQVYRAL